MDSDSDNTSLNVNPGLTIFEEALNFVAGLIEEIGIVIIQLEQKPICTN